MREALTITVFLCIFAASEVLLRKRILTKEIARKCTHLGSGAFTLFLPWLISYASIVWIAGLLTVALLLLQGNALLSSITTSERRTYGAWLLPLGIGTAAFLYPANHLFLPAIAIVTFADGLAGIAGSGHAQKSTAGSAVFFVVALCILGIRLAAIGELSALSVLHSVITALILMLIERISPYGTDNFLLPLATGALILLIA